MGLEGLESTNRLLQAAAKHEPKAVLREELYRVVVDDRQRQTLKATASRLVEWTTWLEEDDDDTVWQQLKQREDRLLGALRMYNGCKVVHVPTYLKGLWKACQEMGNEEAEWNLVPNDIRNVPDTWGERLKDFDCVVFAAGAGMFQSNVLNEKEGFPIQLVRGQSIEMTLPNYENDKAAGLDDHALLCGKYVSPLVEPNRILIGATHEFQTEPLAAASVEEELRGRSYDFASTIWDHGTIDRLTGGYRVQSKRGNHGRLPIVGRCASPYHDYAWIFTGLSSRGLLYHGVFGDCLADMILMNNDGEKKGNTKENVDWWRINS
jgi:glycine/D-amino acid oxidase-like deaminating enzyme